MEGFPREELKLSLPLGGDIVKFASNNYGLPSVAGPRPIFYCASTGYFAVPRMYIVVYLLSNYVSVSNPGPKNGIFLHTRHSLKTFNAKKMVKIALPPPPRRKLTILSCRWQLL